jgi:hypothetical protein
MKSGRSVDEDFDLGELRMTHSEKIARGRRMRR